MNTSLPSDLENRVRDAYQAAGRTVQPQTLRRTTPGWNLNCQSLYTVAFANSLSPSSKLPVLSGARLELLATPMIPPFGPGTSTQSTALVIGSG